MNDKDLARFMSKVEIREGSECWYWTGGIAKKGGYGKFKIGRRESNAHRFIYEHANGETPKGMVLTHSCELPNCVNPSHIRIERRGQFIRSEETKNKISTSKCKFHLYTRTADGTVEQRCRVCAEWKILAEYPMRSNSRHDYRCKQCRSDIAKNIYAGLSEKERELNRKRDRESYKKKASERANRKKEWRVNNPDKCRDIAKKWQQKNPDKVKERLLRYRASGRAKEINDRYRKNNIDRVREKGKKSDAKRWANPLHRASRIFSATISKSIRGGKNGRHWESLVGYTLGDLMRHLEARFKPGMTWENRKDWHIDHRRPVASFDFTSPDDSGFKECWSLSNLQPLWAKENCSKGARYEN